MGLFCGRIQTKHTRKRRKICQFDKIIKKAFYYQIQVCEAFDSYELSKAIGKDHVMVMAIVDEGLKKAFLKEIEREVAYEG